MPGFIDVREYGPEGIFSTIQAALDDGLPNLAGNRTGKTFVIPAGEWEQDVPLRINQRADVRIVGAGRSVVGTVLNIESPIEVIGTNRISFENLFAKGLGCEAGFLIGRTPGWTNSSVINFRDVYCYGEFVYGCWVVIGSEMVRLNGCDGYPTNNAESVLTASVTNEYGINASLPLAEIYNVYGLQVEHSNMIGTSQTPLRLYNAGAICNDTYFYNTGRASIEMINNGVVKLRDCGFEGSPFATVRMTGNGVFGLDFDCPTFGAPEYAIWADDGSKLRHAIIKPVQNNKPVRLWDVHMSDLRGLASYDYRTFEMSVHDAIYSKLAIGPNDTLAIHSYPGTDIDNYGGVVN